MNESVNAPTVFISYHHDERAYAKQLQGVLQSLGYSAWIDQELQANAEWNEEIVDHLSKAKVVIVLWSRRSSKSEWVNFEAAFALGRGVYIGVSIERMFVVPQPFRLKTCKSLETWDGTRYTAGFSSVLAEVEVMTEQHSRDGFELPPQPPWPEVVPTSLLLTTIRSWRSHWPVLVTIFASFVLFLAGIVAIIWTPLALIRSRVDSIGNASETISESVGKSSNSLQSIQEGLGQVRDAVSRSETNLQLTESSAASVGRILADVKGYSQKIQNVVERESLLDTPIASYDIFFEVEGGSREVDETCEIHQNSVPCLSISLTSPPRTEVRLNQNGKVFAMNYNNDFGQNGTFERTIPNDKKVRLLEVREMVQPSSVAELYSYRRVEMFGTIISLDEVIKHGSPMWTVRCLRDLRTVGLRVTRRSPTSDWRCRAIYICINGDTWIAKSFLKDSHREWWPIGDSLLRTDLTESDIRRRIFVN